MAARTRDRRRPLSGDWIAAFGLIAVVGLLLRQPVLVGLGGLVLLAWGVARVWDRLALEKVVYTRSLSQTRAFPGEKVDLFDLDTAPFPIPFGQKKDQILKNFEVKLVPPSGGDPAGTDHLMCIPKPGAAMSKDYEKLEFYVSRELHLPVKVVATELGGKKVTTAIFPDLAKDSINAGLSDKDFAEPGEWKKYGTVEEPLPKQQPEPGQ